MFSISTPSNDNNRPPAAAAVRRVMDVEQALAWTYATEMARGYGGMTACGYGPSPHIRNMFDIYDNPGGRGRRGSHIPDAVLQADGPHPDAITIHDTLSEFAGAELDDVHPEVLGWDLAQGIDHRAEIERCLDFATETVRQCARLRKRPVWLEPARLIPANENWEKPSVSARKPHGKADYPEGTVCLCKFDPSREAVARSRAEYVAWWLVLEGLAARLGDRLRTVRVMQPRAAMRPWAGEQDKGRVLEAVPAGNVTELQPRTRRVRRFSAAAAQYNVRNTAA